VASLVTVTELLIEAYLPSVYETLGIYIPLIVVNCIILGRAEAFAAKNNPIASIFDGIGIGLGFTIALTCLGAARELLGTGAIFGQTLWGESYGMLMFVLAPGAFLALGYLIVVFNKIFKNEKYIGVYQCMDVRIEGGVPAIIDKDTFEKAQRRRASNAHAPAKSKAKVQYLLSGKLICGHCNTLMVGESGVSHTGKAHYYYTCATRKKKQACDKKAIKKDIIERFVTESAMKVLTPETIDRIAEAAIEQNRKDIANDTTISSLTAQINNVEKSIANLLKLAEKVQSSDSLANRLQELEEQKRALTIQLVDAQSNYIELEKDHIVWWLSQFTEGNIDDLDYRRQIIDLLVHSVTVYDSPDGFKVTLTLNLVSKGSAGTLESSDLLFNTSFKTTYPNLYFCDTLVGYTIEFQRE
jgi:hypothetical protein